MCPWAPRANTSCRFAPSSTTCSIATVTTSTAVEELERSFRRRVRPTTLARLLGSTTAHGTGSLRSGLISKKCRKAQVAWKPARRLLGSRQPSFITDPAMGSVFYRAPWSYIAARSARLRAAMCLSFGLCIFASGLHCWASPVLPSFLSDHMVLQQGRSIHLWGKADPGETVTVSLAGHTATTTTDDHNHWSVHLPALPAGGPFTLTAQGRKQVVIKDVMVGEVWIASGQSKMTFAR